MELQKQFSRVDQFFDDFEFVLGCPGSYAKENNQLPYMTFSNRLKKEAEESEEYNIYEMTKAIRDAMGDRKKILVRPGYESGVEINKNEDGKYIGHVRLAFE